MGKPCVAGAEGANVAAPKDRPELLRRNAKEQRLIGERRIAGVTGHQHPGASLACGLATMVSRFLPASRR